MSTTPVQSEIDTRLHRRVARQQVATPLSLLVFIVAAVLAQTVASPTMRELSDNYLTVMTPLSSIIGGYWLVLGGLLVGHCIMLAVPGRSIGLLVDGVGLRIAGVLILMAAWILAFVLKFFLVAQVILLLAFVLALSMWATLFYHPATIKKPVEYLFTHTPIRMLVVVLLQVDIWQGGLLALHYYRQAGGEHKPHWEAKHSFHSWIIFGIILGVAFLQAIQVFFQTDVVWAAASILLYVSLAMNSEGKSPPVFIAIILSACLMFISLISSVGWGLIKSDREGAIRLVDGEEEIVAETV